MHDFDFVVDEWGSEPRPAAPATPAPELIDITTSADPHRRLMSIATGEIVIGAPIFFTQPVRLQDPDPHTPTVDDDDE